MGFTPECPLPCYIPSCPPTPWNPPPFTTCCDLDIPSALAVTIAGLPCRCEWPTSYCGNGGGVALCAIGKYDPNCDPQRVLLPPPMENTTYTLRRVTIDGDPCDVGFYYRYGELTQCDILDLHSFQLKDLKTGDPIELDCDVNCTDSGDMGDDFGPVRYSLVGECDHTCESFYDPACTMTGTITAYLGFSAKVEVSPPDCGGDPGDQCSITVTVKPRWALVYEYEESGSDPPCNHFGTVIYFGIGHDFAFVQETDTGYTTGGAPNPNGCDPTEGPSCIWTLEGECDEPLPLTRSATDMGNLACDCGDYTVTVGT